MAWQILVHPACTREMADLNARDQKRVRIALESLALRLDTLGGGLDVAVTEGHPFDRLPDLRPLRGVKTRGSYRLRVGVHRIALVLLPRARTVLVTTLERRRTGSYTSLVRRHDARAADP